MKFPIILSLSLILVACAAPTVPPQSPDYPKLTRFQWSKIQGQIAGAMRGGSHDVDNLSEIVTKAERGQPLTEQELSVMTLLVQEVHNDEAKEKSLALEEDRRTTAQQEDRDRERERERQADTDRMTDMKAKQFRQSFAQISNPNDARLFREIYAGQPDPDGLLRKATARGYSQGVQTARQCIDRANTTIAQQNQIAREVGYVDKTVMYQAGAALVQCKKNLADWSGQIKR